MNDHKEYKLSRDAVYWLGFTLGFITATILFY